MSSQPLLNSVRHDQSKWIGKPSMNVSRPMPYDALASTRRKPVICVGAPSFGSWVTGSTVTAHSVEGLFVHQMYDGAVGFVVVNVPFRKLAALAEPTPSDPRLLPHWPDCDGCPGKCAPPMPAKNTPRMPPSTPSGV